MSEQTRKPVLETRYLSVRYGKVEALRNASLRLHAGEIVTVIGPNGAGKSSLLNAIMGALPLTGQADGEICARDRLDARFFRGLEKFDEAEQIVAVGDCERRYAALRRRVHEGRDADGGIGERIFAMQLQMGEAVRHAVHSGAGRAIPTQGRGSGRVEQGLTVARQCPP